MKHKDLKGLRSQYLRNHTSEAELIFIALAELSTRQIGETDKANSENRSQQFHKARSADMTIVRTNCQSPNPKAVKLFAIV